jgi:hypothetical protein
MQVNLGTEKSQIQKVTKCPNVLAHADVHDQSACPWTCSMDLATQHGLKLAHAAFSFHVHAPWTLTCSTSKFMLHVRVEASCPCSCCMSMLDIQVHTTCPCPYCMSLSVPQVMSMLHHCTTCSLSRWRPQKVDKRMVLEYTHGLFIT